MEPSSQSSRSPSPEPPLVPPKPPLQLPELTEFTQPSPGTTKPGAPVFLVVENFPPLFFYPASSGRPAAPEHTDDEDVSFLVGFRAEWGV